MRTMIFILYLSDTDELLNQEQKRMTNSTPWCFFYQCNFSMHIICWT